MLKKMLVVIFLSINCLNADSTIYNSGYRVPEPTLIPEGDKLLAQRIRDKILNDRTLSDNARHINISVIDGNVTLRGIVDSDEERNRIVDMVRVTNGVRQIDNRLTLPVIF